MVSLGCEGTDHERLTAEICKTGKPVRIIRIQELGDVSAAIKDTPGREPEILTGMAATGAQFMMFSTGRGAPQGFPTMPVLKVCGNPNTYERMSHDMDINAGRIITGEKSIEEVGEEAFSAILDLLSGKQTKMRPSAITVPSIFTLLARSSDPQPPKRSPPISPVRA